MPYKVCLQSEYIIKVILVPDWVVGHNQGCKLLDISQCLIICLNHRIGFCNDFRPSWTSALVWFGEEVLLKSILTKTFGSCRDLNLDFLLRPSVVRHNTSTHSPNELESFWVLIKIIFLSVMINYIWILVLLQKYFTNDNLNFC